MNRFIWALLAWGVLSLTSHMLFHDWAALPALIIWVGLLDGPPKEGK